MSITLGIALVILFISLQAFFAAAEMNLVSQNRLRLHHLAERKDRKARMILDLLSNPERFLATTLVGANISLIASSAMVNLLVYRIVTESKIIPGIEGHIPIISTLILFPLIIVFGQIVPMSVSRLNSYKLARHFIYPLKAMSYILYPLVIVFSRVSGRVAHLFGTTSHSRNPFVSREELRLLFRDESHTASLDKEGRKMINEIFGLQSAFAEDIMTPLIDIVAAPETSSVDEIIKLMLENGYSHMPIYRGRIDEIIGVVHVYDLIDVADGAIDIKTFIRKPYIIPETKPVFEVLMEFRENNKHIAFAVDEYGGVTGLMTMEDIIEEIVGEIRDEHDVITGREVLVDEGSTIIKGTMGIDEFNESFHKRLTSDDAETIGGLITFRLGRIPQCGEIIEFDTFGFEVLEASDRKVEKVAIKPLTTPPSSGRKSKD